jgi:hypothetical protein
MSPKSVRLSLHGLSKRKVEFLKTIQPQFLEFLSSVSYDEVLKSFDKQAFSLPVDETIHKKLQIIMSRYDFQKGKPLPLHALFDVLIEMFVLNYLPNQRS